MDGTAFNSLAWQGTVSDTSWEIVDVADFDQDNDPDILWHHATSGQNVIWVMDGTVVESYAWLETVADTNWRIVGLADFDQDGIGYLVETQYQRQERYLGHGWYSGRIPMSG